VGQLLKSGYAIAEGDGVDDQAVGNKVRGDFLWASDMGFRIDEI
jgi:hypothetical protein